jgi:DNA anti-recombination protein RmuC
MYRDGKFYTFDLQSFVTNTNTAITNLQNSVNNLQTRVTNIENSIRPIVNRFEEFTNVPSNAKIMLGNINLYSDTNAVVNGSDTATSLDKSHGIYGHALNQDKAQDELFG